MFAVCRGSLASNMHDIIFIFVSLSIVSFVQNKYVKVFGIAAISLSMGIIAYEVFRQKHGMAPIGIQQDSSQAAKTKWE
jgi:hypothetical protein